MNLEDLLGFESEIQEERERSFKLFNEAIMNREFIDQLFEYLKLELEPKIRFLVESSILRVIKINYNQESLFWDYDQQVRILNTLVEYALSVPYQNSQTVVDAIRHIIMSSTVAIIEQVNEIFELFNTMTQQHQFLILLQIMSFWTKLVSITPLSDEETEKFGAAIEEFNAKIVQAFIPITQAFSEDLTSTPYPLKILRVISKCLISLSAKSEAIFYDESFDNLLGLFIQAIQLPSENMGIVKLKRSISRLFIILCKYFLGKDEESPEESIRVEYANHFQSDIAPQFIDIIVYVLENDTDDFLHGNILYLLSQLLFHRLIPVEDITAEFVSNFIIKAARLSVDSINEHITNPQQYIGFYLHYSTNELINRRRGCAKVIEALVKNYGGVEGDENSYQIIDMLYELLLAPTSDPFEFESRIYLMTRYIRDTNTPMGPMVDPQIIEALAETASKLVETLAEESNGQKNDKAIDRTFVLASLLMLMRHTLPYMDPNIGISLGVHCITLSNDEVVITTAAKLIRTSIEESDMGEADFDVIEIIKKLLNFLSSNSPSIPMAIRALMRLGGPSATPVAREVITGMLEFCIDSKTEESDGDLEKITSSFTSAAEIIASLEHDQDALAQTAEQILPMVAEYFVNHPTTKCSDEILYILASLNTKNKIAIPAVYQACTTIANIISEDEVYLLHAEQIACAFCPLILLDSSGCDAEKAEFSSSCFKLCNNILQVCNKETNELTSRDRGYALVLASCLVQSAGESAVIFLPAALEAITLVGPDDSLLYSSATLMIVSCFTASPETTSNAISNDLANYVRTSVSEKLLPTYKEFKLGFALLLYLARSERQPCYQRAVELIKTLSDLKTEEENMSELNGGVIESMILPFQMPIENLNELELFGALTDKYFNTLNPKLKKLVRNIFPM